MQDVHIVIGRSHSDTIRTETIETFHSSISHKAYMQVDELLTEMQELFAGQTYDTVGNTIWDKIFDIQ